MSEPTNPSTLDKIMERARAAGTPSTTDAQLDAILAEVPTPTEAPTPAPTESPTPKSAPVEAAASPAVVVNVSANEILSGAGTLAVREALRAVLGRSTGAVFKVAALQSGYTAELGALAFEDIARLQSSAVDAHAARVKLLRTLHAKIHEFSCGPVKFQDWLKTTAQGDYDTLMYGLYAATYPGDNEFDVRCRHCGHDNKVTANVGDLARAESDDVYAEIRTLLDPKVDHKGAVQNSLVGRTIQRRLPQTGIIAEVRNPSLQDYLDGVQWFTQSQDKQTGQLPVELAGAETIRTLTMYVSRLLVPAPGTNQYLPVIDQAARAELIGRLPRADGTALIDAVDEENKRLEVTYRLPDYNCAACSKRNENLFLDFEALLFIKLREKA